MTDAQISHNANFQENFEDRKDDILHNANYVEQYEDRKEILPNNANFQENFEESITDVKLKAKKRKSLAELKTPRQKFCPRWEIEFPWLRANCVDESVGYCTICKKELVCKKSHLERHQKSYKHLRLQGFESVFSVNVPEVDLIDAHTSGYLDKYTEDDEDEIEEEEYYQDEEVLEDFEIDSGYSVVKTEPPPTNAATYSNLPYLMKKIPTPTKISVAQTNNVTAKPVNNKNSSFKLAESETEFDDLIQEDSEPEQKKIKWENFFPFGHPPAPKDSFDLFFESISATVKSFPPKLAAEVKGKVSQVIAEFELRAICEKEAQERAQQQAYVALNASSSGTSMPERPTATPITYVYSYQGRQQQYQHHQQQQHKS